MKLLCLQFLCLLPCHFCLTFYHATGHVLLVLDPNGPASFHLVSMACLAFKVHQDFNFVRQLFLRLLLCHQWLLDFQLQAKSAISSRKSSPCDWWLLGGRLDVTWGASLQASAAIKLCSAVESRSLQFDSRIALTIARFTPIDGKIGIKLRYFVGISTIRPSLRGYGLI